MNLAIAAAVFPVIFLGELPDKTMFATLVMGSPGRPLAVWVGAAAAFALHVAIAVSVGAAAFAVLPRRVVDGLVAALFLAGATYSFLIRNRVDDSGPGPGGPGDGPGDGPRSTLRTGAGAAAVIFVAEWGDLTQILMANLAARYDDALSVGVGALIALWVVAAIAVAAGTGLLRVLSVRTLRLATAVVLAGLGAYSAVTSFTG